MKKNTLQSGLLMAAALLSLLSGAAQAQDSKEYMVKAAFIYNFVKFVEWPDGKAIAKQSNIDICVLGESPMSSMGSIFQQASTAKLKLSLVDAKSTSEAASHCHVVFVSSSEEGNVSDVISSLRGTPVLTVSDIDDFAEKGGMIGFVVADNKIKVVVNPKAASQSGLRVDAQLLEIALKVVGR